jgi:rhomboid protease GluP
MNEFYQVKKRRGLFDFNITFLLIAVNVICFIAFTAISYFNPDFLDFIALKPANIINHFYIWTFLTSMFMHAGFFHIFANMFSLLFLGNFV